MRMIMIGVLSLLAALPALATYSIVAWDGEEMGVAVQSHWFSVGNGVVWAEAGVGAVATQSFVEVSYGPLGLDLMRGGKSAAEALKALLAADEGRAVRQVGMVDAAGTVAAWTGPECIAFAGHIEGEHFTVESNIMRNNTVPQAMAASFRSSTGPLAERLLKALEAAEAAGGDLRGKQSAAIRVVKVKPSGPAFRNVVVDLRVEDSPAPLPELRRLWTVHQAYEAMNRGDEALAKKDTPGALKEYSRAAALMPTMAEIRFWQGVTLWTAGEEGRALEVLRPVLKEDPNLLELLRRLPAAQQLPEKDLPRILDALKGKQP
jgi:uncharacterized Ntn-hydrolase superfamily protein